MVAIVRFNWPFYVGAGVVMVLALGVVLLAPGSVLQVGAGTILGGSAYFAIGSLAVSHLIYDRSDLYRWGWLKRAFGGVDPRRIVFCHTGFDETSEDLRARMQDVDWQVLDHFDEASMTESSIRRARRLFPPAPGTVAAMFDRWPLEAESADAVLALLAIHELRTVAERTAWFQEARRCLRPEGRIVVVEHLRNLPNALAFGPGFVHFHSRKSWDRSWQRAGLACHDEFAVTPWIRVFVLTAAS